MHNGVAKPFQCTECTKNFATKSKLNIHLRTHTGEKPFSCSECGKKFATQSYLNNHFKVHTGEKSHICSICSRAFTDSAGLKRHILRHKGERNYTCKICNKSYITNADLAMHVRRHRVEEHHSCSVCGKTFMLKYGLKKHIARVHLKIKKFPCSICNKDFSDNYALRKHEEVHQKRQESSGSLEFSCEICNRKFIDKRTAVRHTMTHTAKKTICPICRKEFEYESSLKYHLKLHDKAKAKAVKLEKTLSNTSEILPEDQVHVYVKEETNDTNEIQNLSLEMVENVTIKQEGELDIVIKKENGSQLNDLNINTNKDIVVKVESGAKNEFILKEEPVDIDYESSDLSSDYHEMENDAVDPLA